MGVLKKPPSRTGETGGLMLALNITRSLHGKLDGRPRNVRSCTEYWWDITDATLTGYADVVLPVDSNVIAGAFEVRRWRRDPQFVGKVPGGKVVFTLAEAPDWQWLIGQPSPVTWSKSQANPVRKVGAALVSELRSRRPHHIDAEHGWSLDVEPGGTAATVRGPGDLTVTAMRDGAARLALTGIRS
jgi:hypothetical protein